MRILNRYLIVDYLIIFLSSLGLVTFVMSIGAMVKAVDLMAKGISPLLILKFFLQNIPYILSYSMPISTLFAALLLFGRLSMDSEISAMKACGVSLWRTVAPLIVLSVLFSAICVHINCTVAPNAKYARKKLLRTAGVDEPVNLLEEGRYVRFDNYMIYVGRKDGLEMQDVVARELSEKGPVKQSLHAARGEVEVDETNKTLRIHLYDGNLEVPDLEHPLDVSKTTYTPFAAVDLPPLDFNELLNEDGKVWIKDSYMPIAMLIDKIRHVDEEYPALSEEERAVERCKLVIEANRRVALAVACFTFMLIGIPLGVKSHRRETSIGMVMSLGIVFAYYIFIIIAEALADYPALHPSLILWLPLLATQILGLVLIRRSN